jgi:hypothetical protein
MKRLLSHDPVTRTTTYHHYDPSTNQTLIETVQDVKPILERNKRLANNTDYKKSGIKKDWYHFATVPNVILMELKTKYHLDFNRKEDLPKIEKVLQRDYKRLLTVDRI